MTLKKNGLNDSDKILVTVSLWITAVTLFITALTLPMLPSKVTIFYPPANIQAADDAYSKYNNLMLILITVVPMAIIMIAAAIKRHNRMQNNFTSIILFSIMLSVSISCIVIYGISQQFSSSIGIKKVNFHAIAVIALLFVMSVLSSSYPAFNHRNGAKTSADRTETFGSRLSAVADKYWNIGAYGYLAMAVAASFIPEYYAYIPLAVGVIAHVLFLCLKKPNAVSVRKSDKQDSVKQ